MNRIPVIAVFDAGKTNKKILLFDRGYHVVHEESCLLEEAEDEDGFPCEDVSLLTDWVCNGFRRMLADRRYQVEAVNFSAYGASLVYLDDKGKVIPPLYNYLKPCSQEIQNRFYETYGGEQQITKETASPVLGNLNSGMQLYSIKYEKPELFARIRYALHLPQYLSYVLSGSVSADITSIGCHTNLWHFAKNDYHRWVKLEGILEKLPPILPCTTAERLDLNAAFLSYKSESPDQNLSNTAAGTESHSIAVGGGLHDTSAALIPYLTTFREPFVLLSTGTWCISLNPFNHSPLSRHELDNDCLCYLSHEGKPVKASRLFTGSEHDEQVQRLAGHFHKPLNYYTTVSANAELIRKSLLDPEAFQENQHGAPARLPVFALRDLTQFRNYEEAYHQLVSDLMQKQKRSTEMVLKGIPIKKIFVAGGFAYNPVFLQLLAIRFPETEVYAAAAAQASAVGAALAIHREWNPYHVPSDLVKAKPYSTSPGREH